MAKPISRHHNEWMSLVPASGPFLSLSVLNQVLPQGLDAHDSAHAKLLRQEFANWEEEQESRRPDPGVHRRWIKFVLEQSLGYDKLVIEGQAIPQALQSIIAEYGETLRPDCIVIDPSTQKPRVLVQIYAPKTSLSTKLGQLRWGASPETRMMQLLHDTGIRLGLVTNGEHWMLVNAAKNETTGFISWYANLWLDEPDTLRAFRTLLSAERLFGKSADETLEALLDKSASDQQEVTDQLGYQVRKAVEVLVQALDRADKDHGGKLLEGVPEKALYESALTLMMRLVFLFCAEERELLLLGDDLYDRSFAVSTLREQLQAAADQSGEEILERRFDAWPRLLTTFRAVYSGINHDRVKLPAYGGSLFNPDRFPFLEGRAPGSSWKDTEASPLPVNNRTVLHLLDALQMLRVRLPGGGPSEARRLSFRSLDIEQIGHVYEGLLDHTAVRATEPVLGLIGTKNKEPEIALAELEKVAAKGEKELLEFLTEETGRSEAAIKRCLAAEIDLTRATRFSTTCQDSALSKRVQPYEGLVRDDTNGYPVVITKGTVYVTAGTDRRSSGTHYTPRSLTEPIVQYTLEPLVYMGPAEGLPKEQWKLKPAKELLDLKICDMACGSGAFLVQACRYMATRLQEAWAEVQRANPKVLHITPDGQPALGKPGEMLVPDDPDERQVYAMRIVAQHCLYGVDKNPLAVEIAKLSLWLLTLAKNKAFEFLDHALRSGDSLVGIHNLDQLRKYRLDGKGDTIPLFAQYLEGKIKEVIALRRRIADGQSDTLEAVDAQDQMLRDASANTEWLRCAADLLVSAEFTLGSPADKRIAREEAYIEVSEQHNRGDLNSFRVKVKRALNGNTAFHWPLEFPEVRVQRGGFDAIVGNPPFVGGKRLGTVLGPQYQSAIKSLYGDSKGAADLCAYFFLRANKLLRENGCFGLLATNTIAQGDTKEIALDHMVNNGMTIVQADASRPWPGAAGVCVAVVFGRNGKWNGTFILNGQLVPSISSALTSEIALGPAHPLSANKGLIAEGIKIHGNGFIISLAERNRLIKEKPRNDKLIQMYIGGEDVASHPSQESNRFVINFQNWDKTQALEYPELFAILTERVKPYRESLSGQIHETRYWLFWDRRESFFHQLKDAKTVLVCSGTAKYLAPIFIRCGCVLSQKLKVFQYQEYEWFSVLQSDLHDAWARRTSSTLGETLSYSNSDAFLTFPMPDMGLSLTRETLARIGKTYHTNRSTLMRQLGKGITEFYNYFHDPATTESEVQGFRKLHIELDTAVATAYGWNDLDLGHTFHETKQGLRYTISEPARREVLARLLKLNHERHAEEVRQGLHDKKKAKPAKDKKSKSAPDEGPGLFDQEELP